MFKNFLKKINFPESYVSITLGFLVVIVGGLILYNYFTQQKGLQEEIATEPGEPTITQTIAQKLQKLPTTYTVTVGDTLWKIAMDLYGSGYNWVTLRDANKLTDADHIQVGQELSAPVAQVIVPPQVGETMGTAAQPRDYTVKQGDSLWKIALSELGNAYRWSEIAQNNVLANPDIIHPGNVLKIPAS